MNDEKIAHEIINDLSDIKAGIKDITTGLKDIKTGLKDIKVGLVDVKEGMKETNAIADRIEKILLDK